MLTIQDESGFVLITATGRLTDEDYDRFVPAFERLARERGPLAMLIDATAFEGWDLEGLWRELKFDTMHRDAFGPMAIVGDERWKDWGTKLSNLFLAADMRFFHPDQIDDARSWLRSSAPSNADRGEHSSLS